MKISLSTKELKEYIQKQMDHFFPDGYKFMGNDVDSAFDLALQRSEYCFKHINNIHYCDRDGAVFSHLHSDQYSAFLYFLSNSLWKQSENKQLCDKIIFLNKSLNGMFYSYKCKLPNVFVFVHPVGTIVGNAEYSDFLVIFQNVTINTNDSTGIAPRIGKGVFLGAGSSIIGSQKIGDFTSIGVNSLIYNKEIPDKSVAFTDCTGLLNIVPSKKECAAQYWFNVDIEKD